MSGTIFDIKRFAVHDGQGIRTTHLLPFHNTAKGKYIRTGKENRLSNLKSLQKDEIKEIEQQFVNAGFFCENRRIVKIINN